MRWLARTLAPGLCALALGACSNVNDGAHVGTDSGTGTDSSAATTDATTVGPTGTTADSDSDSGPTSTSVTSGTSGSSGADSSSTGSGGTGTQTTGTAGTTGGQGSTGGGSGSSGGTTGSTGGTTGSTSGTTGSTGGSTGGTTGGVSEPECIDDKDCKLQNDCCGCEALEASATIPPCNIQCLVPLCQPLGITAVECRFGTCTFADVSCDPDLVTCQDKEPNCPKGQLPKVSGNCWAGCTDVEACDVVPDCSHCTDAQVCVQMNTQLGPKLSCEPIPTDCKGTPDCACAGAVCESPFDQCVDGQNGIECNCPVCG